MARSLPRPAYDLDRQDRLGVQADEGRRGLLARRFDQPMLQRIYATAFARQDELDAYLNRSRKPSGAIIAGSAAKWICSISRRKGRAPSFGIRRAGRCSRR